MSLSDFLVKKNSKDIAKDRLKLLVISDRANCSPDVMDMIKKDFIKVISKYMEIDSDELTIQITQTVSKENNGILPVLLLNVPIKDINYRK